MIHTTDITNQNIKLHVNSKRDTPILTKPLLWLITLTTGVVVGNNYYNQPLLGLMAKDFHVSEAAISMIAMLTQIGFATGLLFIVPLGDMIKRKKEINIINFSTHHSLLIGNGLRSHSWAALYRKLYGWI
ncbi:hypothetical protein D3C73_541510 [compost metagenome]